MNLSNFPIEALSKEALISLVKAYDQQITNNNNQKIDNEKLKNEVKEYKKICRDDGFEMMQLEKKYEELKKENEDLKKENKELKNPKKKSKLLKEKDARIKELEEQLKKLNETGEDDSDSEEEEEEGKKKYLDNDGLNEEDGEEVEDIF